MEVSFVFNEELNINLGKLFKFHNFFKKIDTKMILMILA